MSEETVNKVSGRIYLPPDIMAVILPFADWPSRYQVLRTCKAYYDVAVPHLYCSVKISAPRQLRSFASVAGKAREDRWLAYIPDSKKDAKNKKLYASLGDIAGYSTSSEWLFPHLKSVSFEPLPACDFTLPISISTPASTPFLSNAHTVTLVHSKHTNYDKPPHFHSLGMTSVRHLEAQHLFGAEMSNVVDLRDYLGYQGCLETIRFRLGGHFRYTLNGGADSDSDEAEEGHDLSAEDEHALGANDNGFYIYEYGTSVASTVWSIINAKNQLFPLLKEVVVEFDESCYHDLLVVGSSKERIYNARMEAIALEAMHQHSSMTIDSRRAVEVIVRSGRDRWVYDTAAVPQEGEDFYRYKSAWRLERDKSADP